MGFLEDDLARDSLRIDVPEYVCYGAPGNEDESGQRSFPLLDAFGVCLLGINEKIRRILRESEEASVSCQRGYTIPDALKKLISDLSQKPNEGISSKIKEFQLERNGSDKTV